MFIEPQIRAEQRGWIEVICGPMFSGKTEELIRRLKRAKIANKKVEIFKPHIDTRYDKKDIVSHDYQSIPSTPISHSENMLLLSKGVEVVGVDEAQFFDEQLPSVINQLSNKGIRVIAAGLDMDFKGQPFGIMPSLLAMAEYVTKLHAICVRCGNVASFSYRLTIDDSLLLVGEKDKYEPRCRSCFLKKD